MTLKILDFPPHPFSENQYTKKLLWPCAMYSVLVPISNDQGFNIFEKTALKLLKIRPFSKSELADLMCLHPNTISFILDRLKQNEVLTEDLKVNTAKTNELLGNQTPLMTSIYVFVDLCSGTPLPFVSSSEIKYLSSEKRKDGISVREKRIGLDGKLKTKYHVSHKIEATCQASQPNSHQVIAAIKNHNLLNFRYETQGYHVPIYLTGTNFEQGIIVPPEAETVYLFCDAFVNNAEIQVTDGFGYTISANFTRHIKTLRGDENEWQTALKENSAIKQDEDEKQNYDLKNISAEILNDSVLSKMIPLLHENMKRIPLFYPTQREGAFDNQFRAFHKASWETIEHIFVKTFQSFSEEDLNRAKNIYSGSNEQNKRRAIQFAKQLGFQCSSNLHLFSFSFHKTKKTIETLLPVLLALSAVMNKGILQYQEPDFLLFLENLKQARNSSRHGDSIELYRYFGKELWKRYERVRKLLFLWKPSLHQKNISFTQEEYQAEVSQNQYLADNSTSRKIQEQRLTLERKLGVFVCNQLPHFILNSLCEIEAELRKDSPNIYLLFNRLYGAIQQILFLLQCSLQDRFLPLSVDSTKTYIERLEQQYTDLPKTNQRALHSAIQGRSESPNAQTLVLLIYSMENNLNIFSPAELGFIRQLSKISGRSGHGENIQSTLEEFTTLQFHLYQLIQKIINQKEDANA